jgi:hypothetical protein
MVREMATGAVFMTAFGLAWMVWSIWLLKFPARLSIALYLAAIVIAAGLFAEEVPLLHEPSTAAAQIHWHDLRSRFLLINFVQYIAIAGAIAICLRWRRRDLMPIAISLIIGLHFIPLAGLFGFPPYYAVAAGVLALDLSALFLKSPAREVTCCLGTGCILWLSALFVLLRASSSV